MKSLRCPLMLLVLLAMLPGAALAAGQDPADDVFYQFMPISWRDSNNDASRFGDFGGMTASLDYLDSLGVTAIWMNPIFPSPAYHGYQHGDASQLNPWFGTEADLVAFLEAAHARGIRVFVDYVAYGISQSTSWFQSAYNNPSSPYDSWLAFTNSSNTQYLGSVYTTWNGSTVGFIHWDLRNANPVSLVTQWAQHWLDPNGDGDFSDGLDGYRLDHVWQYYGSGPDGWGYNIDTFWAPWRLALRSVNPNVFVFAEQADWGIHGEQLFGGMDATFTKPFEFAARDALAGEYAAPLRSEMLSTWNAAHRTSTPGTFVCTIGNHDVGRLASVIGDNFAKGKAAAAVLMTQPFAPIIYYGDEIGMRGTKNTGYSGDASDIPMREPMKWNAVAGPPMSNYFVLNSAAYNGRVERNNDGRSVEEQDGVPGSLLEAYKDLIAARRGNVALRRGDYQSVPNTSGAVWTFLRDHADQQILVAINVSGTPANDVLNLTGFEVGGGSTTPVDVVTGATLPAITTANRAAYPLSLPAYGYRLLDVDLTPLPFTPTPGAIDGYNIPGDFGQAYLFATQTTPTAMGDNLSELDQLYVRTATDTLLIGVTGNLDTDGTGFALFLDTVPGGQNVLDLSGYSGLPPQEFTGLRFDAGFEPDRLLYGNIYNGVLYIDELELLTGGGAIKTYRGSSIVGSTDGYLSGGTNPHGMQIVLENSNTLGVTGTSADSAATATTGFEIALPFTDVDLVWPDTVTIRLAAFLCRPDGYVGNQWLPGLGAGTGLLGYAPDLTLIPGAQYAAATLPLEAGGVEPGGPWPFAFAAAYVGASRSLLAFTWSLPDPTPMTLRVYDIRGRLVRTLLDGDGPAGEGRVEWAGVNDAGMALPAGVYFAAMDAGTRQRSIKFVLMR